MEDRHKRDKHPPRPLPEKCRDQAKLKQERADSHTPTGKRPVGNPRSQGMENSDLLLFGAPQHPVSDVGCGSPLPTDVHNLSVSGKEIDLDEVELEQANGPGVVASLRR